MRLDGFGLFVNDMGKMIRFYRDVLGFEIQEAEDTSNVYLVKDGTLFLLYGRKDFENMTSRKYEYVKGLNGHSEIALYVDTFDEVDTAFRDTISKGSTPCFWSRPRTVGASSTCYIADPEGNLIEIGHSADRLNAIGLYHIVYIKQNGVVSIARSQLAYI